MLGHRLLYGWKLKRAKRILARPRKYLAAVSNPILGRGHLGTQLAGSHTEWPIKEMITSGRGLSVSQTHFPGQSPVPSRR
jgi:hypothetical protein